jgi:pyruvate ferredoxin oxidoreductase gamma subunit
LAISLINLYSIQSFPEFEPERMGAPVKAFTRISKQPIRLHCGISNPDYVVVFDPTLLKSEERVDEIYGHLKPNGFVILNSPTEVKTPYTFTVDAGKIAEKYLGKGDRVNIAMIGALKKTLDKLSQFPEIPFESLESTIRKTFPEDKNPGVAEKNIAAMKEVYDNMKFDIDTRNSKII